MDIFTNRKDYIGLQSLDSITQKDSIISNFTQNNPIQKAAFDIKYRLLNKRDWSNAASGTELGGSKESDGFRASHIHSKIIIEIMEIFHFLLDLRQNYLMANIVEMFHKRVYTQKKGTWLSESETNREKAMKSMVKDFKRVLPDAEEFTRQMSYTFPSVDEMYEDKEFEAYRTQIQNMDLNIDMHDDFLILLIDTFNVSSNDAYLQQMTLTIICRYYSERSELVRNIERMTLILDEDEWKFYKWVNITIDQFTRDTEKSALWLIDHEEYDEDEYIDRVNNYLYQLRAALYQKFSIEYDEEGGLVFEHVHGERKINKFAQRVFRSLKVYDHLINFTVQNEKLLIFVRTCDESKMGETERNRTVNIEKIFRRCMNILEGFTIGNAINQQLMWKYKDKFVFPELGSSEEDGELEFVLAIIDGNENIATTRSLNLFIQNLNKRMGNQSNFVILLDIYNKLMDFETMGKIKKSLIKLILEHPEMLDHSKKKDRPAFEASLNVKEILFHILNNQELSYTRDSFISFFPLEDFINRLEKPLNLLEKLENEEEDEDVDEQEYEEFRESHQQVVIDLYSNLHFDKRRSDVNVERIMTFFHEQIGPYYEEKLDYCINEVDLDDPDSYKLSQIKLVILHMQILISHIKECVELVYDKQLSRSGGSQSMMLNIEDSRKMVTTIDSKVSQFVHKLKKCQNDDIKDLLNQILEKEDDEDELDEDGNISDRRSENMENRINVINPNGSQTNMSIKLSEIVNKNEKKQKKSKNIKMKNRRSKDSLGYGKAWALYVTKISGSRYVRDLSNEEQNSVAQYIFDALTKPPTDESEELNVFSLKKFLANTIDYACD